MPAGSGEEPVSNLHARGFQIGGVLCPRSLARKERSLNKNGGQGPVLDRIGEQACPGLHALHAQGGESRGYRSGPVRQMFPGRLRHFRAIFRIREGSPSPAVAVFINEPGEDEPPLRELCCHIARYRIYPRENSLVPRDFTFTYAAGQRCPAV